MNENEIDQLDFLSEDVQEILNTSPTWMMTWGTSVIVMVLFLLGVVGWFFKYPERVTEKVTLTTKIPPYQFLAPQNLTISKFYARENDKVKLGQTLFMIEDDADLNDVEKLEVIVDRLLVEKGAILKYEPDDELKLGEIYDEYNRFSSLLKGFTFFRNNNLNKQSLNELGKMRSAKENEIGSLQEKLKIADLDIEVAEQLKRKRQQELLKADSSDQSLALDKLERAVDQLQEKKKEKINILEEIHSNTLDLGDITLNELQIENNTQSGRNKSTQDLLEALKSLKNKIERWKKEHLIKSPETGTLKFFTGNPEGKTFLIGEEILSIIPPQQEGLYVGNMNLPIRKISKVEVGQEVLLKFDRYPFREFGHVKGKVIDMKPSSNTDIYKIEIEPVGGLVTCLEKKLDFQHMMSGKGEIITKDKRFITRLLEKFIAIFKPEQEG